MHFYKTCLHILILKYGLPGIHILQLALWYCDPVPPGIGYTFSPSSQCPC